MHIFAHNGWLPGLSGMPDFQLSLFRPVGETDSEHAFCVLLERMMEIWMRAGDIPSLDERLTVVASFAKALRMFGPANFLYSSGDALLAHGHRRR